MRIGPYELLETLGEGGMGVVYRARGTEGQEVALKTARAASEDLLRGLRREIHALARLRHPGIVRILDEGVERGLPWYAMELIQGVTLDQYAEGLWEAKASVSSQAEETLPPQAETRTIEATLRADEPPPPTTTGGGRPIPGPRRAILADGLPKLLGLLHRLCGTLGFLHGEGIVHRDLKPRNILVRQDARPVIVDFGLTTRFGGRLSRDVLETDASTAGTLPYMAPEQIRGELLDARADLYSLGCILYELLTGYRPFEAAGLDAMAWALLPDRPPAPSSLAAGVPDGLDELVLQLLEKELRDRLGYADDIATRLERLGADAGGWGAMAPAAKAYLYRPRLAGREEELARLEQELWRLERGAGAMALVGGESGAGKTRLLLEVSRRAERRARVIAGECEQGNGSALHPLQGWFGALADRCRRHGARETERLLGQRGRILAPYAPALAGLPGQDAHAEPVELPPEAARLRVFLALTETLRQMSVRKPMLLVLDDLQWADELTLGWLELMATGSYLDGIPAALLGAYRSEELGKGGAESIARFERLLDANRVVKLGLGRLDTGAVAAIARDMLALRGEPRSFADFLQDSSEGNPFFVAEYLRTAVAEGVLWRDGHGHWQIAEGSDRTATRQMFEELPLPRSIHELAARRMAGLPSEALALAEAASAIGRESDAELAGRVSGLPEAARLEALTELLRRQVLEPAGPGAFRFAHDKLREVAYAGIDEARRRAMHRAAAEALEAMAEPPHATLGRHWERAGAPELARPHYLEAGRRATRRYEIDEANRCYLAYLRLADRPTPEKVQARQEWADEILQLRGRNAEALHELEHSLEEARSLGERGLQFAALRALGRLHLLTGRMERAGSSYEQALRLAREDGDRSGEAFALGGLANLLRGQGRMEEALPLYEQTLRLRRETGDRKAEGQSLANLGILHMSQGRFDEARSLMEEALQISRDLDDRRSEGTILSNLANMDANQGRLELARERFGQALERAREAGDRRAEGIALGNLAHLHESLGATGEARKLFEQALAIYPEVNDPRSESFVLLNLASLEREEGRLESARRLSERSLELSRGIGVRQCEALALGSLASLEMLENGSLARAEELAAEGVRILEGLNDRLELGKALCGLGHIELAGAKDGRACLERARAIAIELDVDSASELGQRVAELERAVERDLRKAPTPGP